MTTEQKIAVTGGSGRLGSAIARDVAGRAGTEVLSLDVVERRDSGHFQHLDILSLNDVEESFKGMDAVIHAAAMLGPEDPEAQMFNVNVLGTWNVLEGASRAGVRKVVLISSECASGIINITGVESVPPEYLPVDEMHALKPNETYSLTKQVSEIIAQSYARRGAFQVVVLRPTLVIDKDMKDYITQVREQDDPGLWSYVELRDVVQAARRALSYEGPRYDTFYLSAKDTFSKEPTLDFIRRKFGALPEVRNPDMYQRNPFAAIWDVSRAEDRLKWTPESDWRVCLED